MCVYVQGAGIGGPWAGASSTGNPAPRLTGLTVAPPRQIIVLSPTPFRHQNKQHIVSVFCSVCRLHMIHCHSIENYTAN